MHRSGAEALSSALTVGGRVNLIICFKHAVSTVLCFETGVLCARRAQTPNAR